MEKKQKNTYAHGPWFMKKAAMDNFFKVTELNWPNTKRIGRILYIIDTVGTQYQFRGTFVIEPCFTEGTWSVPFRPWMRGYPGHFTTTFPKAMDYTEWAATNKALVEKYISEKILYGKLSDPILTYIKQ